jgi:hypothetical protein
MKRLKIKEVFFMTQEDFELFYKNLRHLIASKIIPNYWFYKEIKSTVKIKTCHEN